MVAAQDGSIVVVGSRRHVRNSVSNGSGFAAAEVDALAVGDSFAGGSAAHAPTPYNEETPANDDARNSRRADGRMR